MGLAPQLERIVQELEAARNRAHAIAAPLAVEDWGRRPAPDQWSVAECLIHLNLTSDAFLPLIREAIARGREQHLVGAGPFRRDLIGWFVYRMTEPPVRFPVKTTDAFVPGAAGPKARVLEAFDSLQAQLLGCVRAADGLDLRRLRIRSPFAARLRYNLYSCLTIIPAHQRQHLAQAEEAGRAIAVT
jgi:hypothetical protein